MNFQRPLQRREVLRQRSPCRCKRPGCRSDLVLVGTCQSFDVKLPGITIQLNQFMAESNFHGILIGDGQSSLSFAFVLLDLGLGVGNMVVVNLGVEDMGVGEQLEDRTYIFHN